MSSPSDNIPPDGYLRPGDRWVCGRAAAYGKPCASGPGPHGQCGGTGECRPERTAAGGFRCNRAASAGGPCDAGPDTGGTCSQRLPACVPRASLRHQRGRLVAAGASLALLLLIALVWNPLDAARPGPSLDPGPLSVAHARFVGAQNCAACHGETATSLAGISKALLQRHDFSGHCAQCHAFGGPERTPHNERWPVTRGKPSPDCSACHTEHHGTKTLLSRHTDQQCHACHQRTFDRFNAGHPPFPELYPAPSGGIRFDHASHLDQHFHKPEFAGLAPAGCATCHTASASEPSLGRAGFATTCAGCHEKQILENDLVLLRLPEPVPSADAGTLLAEDNTRLIAWLLQRAGGSFGGGWFTLQSDIAESGPAALAKAAGGSTAAPLLAGLSGDLLKPAAKQWLAQTQFAPAGGDPTPGWHWLDDLFPELRYRPVAHADPVVRAWMELAWSGTAPASSAEESKRLAFVREEFLDPAGGPGRCAKCHELPPADAATVAVRWTGGATHVKAHTRFSHGAHLGLLNCADCHRLAVTEGKSAGRPVSSFRSVSLAHCTGCHAQDQVRSDCRLCHSYHNAPALRSSWRDHASIETAVFGTAMQARQEPDSTVTPGSRR